MGMIDWFRGRRSVSASEITIGSVPPPPTGDLAPSIVRAIESPWAPGLLGYPIPRGLAMRVPAVRRGIRVIAGAISSMPLTRWSAAGLLPPGQLLTQPEVQRPACNSINKLVEDLILYPYAWWLVVERDWTGYPSRVIRLEPEYVQVETAPGSDEVVSEWATYRGQLVHVRDLIRFESPDEGLLTFGAEDIITAVQLEASARQYARPGVPTGYLKADPQAEYELDQAEIDDLIERWDNARAGGRNTAYLNRAMIYQTVSTTPEALQLVQAREESALQISRHLNLPPRYVSTSSGDSLTYSNLPSERRELLEISLAPYINAIAERLSMPDRNGSPRTQRIRFDVDAFLRPSPQERAEIYSKLVPLGVTTVAEAREVETGTSSPASAPLEVTP